MSQKTNETDLVYAEAYKHLLEQLSSELKKNNINVTPDTITSVITMAMELVEASQVKGEEQKRLVTEVVRKIVVDAPISDDKEKLLLDMIDQGVVGNVIELVVSATKGEINVNAAKKAAAGCCWGLAKNVKTLNKK
tara:strand:+ start:257 stop:664 length:408 start_codon:yes stop_codon:yes gene_type:complete